MKALEKIRIRTYTGSSGDAPPDDPEEAYAAPEADIWTREDPEPGAAEAPPDEPDPGAAENPGQEYILEHRETISETITLPMAGEDTGTPEQAPEPAATADNPAAPVTPAALPPDPVLSPSEETDLHADTVVLLKYALSTGRKIPEKVAQLLHQHTLDSLIQAYQELSQLIKPALPESVLYLARRQEAQQHRLISTSVPVVRSFMLVGIGSFVLLMLCGCSPMVNEANLAGGLLNNSGFGLLLNLLFISSVSSLGAVFSILPKITWQVRHATYLPESSMYYWSMLMLGIFGGLIMGELLSIRYNIPGTPMKFDTVVFSLMGGFASESVFLILKMLMSKIQQLLVGNIKDQPY